MLKNKKITYLLIALVALIWGLVFYKIYSKFGGEKPMEKNLTQPLVNVEKEQSDSIFTLLLNYPDPFLKRTGQQNESFDPNVSKTAISPPVVNWPLIEYRGLMTNNSKNGSTGLLKVQNSNLLVKQGIVYAAIKIRTITKDSIFLEYKKGSRWFPILK